MISVLPVDADHNRTGAGITGEFTGVACTGSIKIMRIIPDMIRKIFVRFFMMLTLSGACPGKFP